ncbi:MAG TPA: PDZ domain-containing protein, partial [Edaphobacter sp.]
PFGLSQTVSAGIVSARNRSIDEGPSPSGVSQSQFQRFIQTDAAINPGNSGGPLVDMAGNVIGMNTAIFTQSMGSQGVGFAMPSNTIAGVYNNLIGPDHKVVRGSIGISFQPGLSSAVGRMYGFTNGVLVSQVTPNGGAAKAGLQAGDVIVSVDDQKIKDGDDLVNIISARKVGSSVKLGYMRNGKLQTANVVIGDRAKTYADIAGGGDNEENAAPQEADAGQTTLGITVEAIPQAVQQRTGIKSGVVVTSVKPGSFAEEIGLGKAAIITEINKKPVTDKASYNAIVSGLKSKDDVVFVIHNANLKNSGNSYVGGTLP